MRGKPRPLAGYGWTCCLGILIVAIAGIIDRVRHLRLVWFPRHCRTGFGTWRGADHLRHQPDERQVFGELGFGSPSSSRTIIIA